MRFLNDHIFNAESKVYTKILEDLNEFVRNISTREKVLIADISIVF